MATGWLLIGGFVLLILGGIVWAIRSSWDRDGSPARQSIPASWRAPAQGSIRRGEDAHHIDRRAHTPPEID